MFCVPPFSNTYKITPWGILWHKVVLRVQKQSCPRGLGAVAASVSRLAGHTPNHQGSPARQPITHTPLVNYTSLFLPLCQSLTLSFSFSLCVCAVSAVLHTLCVSHLYSHLLSPWIWPFFFFFFPINWEPDSWRDWLLKVDCYYLHLQTAFNWCWITTQTQFEFRRFANWWILRSDWSGCADWFSTTAALNPGFILIHEHFCYNDFHREVYGMHHKAEKWTTFFFFF